jgi:rubrerythrin
MLDFAIRQEDQAHNFYMDLAQRVDDADLRDVLKGFAVDELQHGIRLQAIRAGETAFDEDEVGSLNVAETVHDVVPTPEMSYSDLLVIAMKKEKAAFRLYTNLASIATKEAFRDTLLSLAKEEAQHKLRLEIEYDWTAF